MHDLTAAVWARPSWQTGDLSRHRGWRRHHNATGKEKKVLRTFNMGTAVYGRSARAQHAVRHESQSAVRARGEMMAVVRLLRSAFCVCRTTPAPSARRTSPVNDERRTSNGAHRRSLVSLYFCLRRWCSARKRRPRAIAGPSFRGNSLLTGVTASATPPRSSSWKLEVGDRSIRRRRSRPEGHVGSSTGDLVAVDLASGKLKWKYSAGSPIGGRRPPCTGDGLRRRTRGRAHAVRNARRQPGMDVQDGAGDQIVPGGRRCYRAHRSYDGHLYALDAATGALRWKFATDGPVHSTPAIQDGIAFVAGCDESLRAIGLADGREQYHIVAGANTAASPVIGGGRVYVGTFNNEVLAIDLRGRKIAWRYENPDRQFPFYSSAALANGRVIVGSRDKLLHAIDAGTGTCMGLHDAGAVDSCLRWPTTRGTRIPRRTSVRPGRCEWTETLGVRTGSHHGFAALQRGS